MKNNNALNKEAADATQQFPPDLVRSWSEVYPMELGRGWGQRETRFCSLFRDFVLSDRACEKHYLGEKRDTDGFLF